VINKDFVIPDGAGDQFVNTAYVVCSPEGFDNIYTDNDSWTTDLLHPDYTLTKSCADDSVLPGETAVFEIVLDNTGDVDLWVVLDEDVIDDLGNTVLAGTQISLSLGGPITFTYEVEDAQYPGVDNTIHATATLPAWTGLPNMLERESSATCPLQTGALLPTQTTCDMYKAGLEDWTLWPDMYTSFNYIARNGAIKSVSPGVIFYYNRITVTDAGDIVVLETNEPKPQADPWRAMLYQSAGQAILYEYETCRKSGEGTPVLGVENPTGTYRVTFSDVPAGEYIIGIKYSPRNVIGQSVNDGDMRLYTWQTSFDGTYVPGTTASIPWRQKK
jgi:hypothetical protein